MRHSSIRSAVLLLCALGIAAELDGQGQSLDNGGAVPSWEGGASLPPAIQDAEAVSQAIASWVAVDMATGYESRLAPDLAENLPGFTADQWGNLVTVTGSGSPRRIVACALDRPSYAVSQIREDGYLRLHRIGRGSRHPLWDQAFEAQQVRILTRTGPVSGVVGRSNGHFAAQHRGETAVVTADDLWLDVGAESAEEVGRIGIGLLDPVGRHLPPWPIPGGVAGPDVGRRAGCAAVASLAAAARAGRAPDGETHFLLSAQEGFGWVGVSSYLARNGDFDAVVLAAPGGSESLMEDRAADGFGRFGDVLASRNIEAIQWAQPAVRSPGAHMEVLTTTEAGLLIGRLAQAVGAPVQQPDWVAAPDRAPLRTGHMAGDLTAVARTLTDLVERHGVPGHEWSLRRYVLEALPAWARERAVVDDIGNIMVEMGPDRDTTVFMAHIDEVGYWVDTIDEDGTVSLRRQGGAVASAWEGQTALLHFEPVDAPSTRRGSGDDTNPMWKRQSLTASAPDPIPGVFLTRDRADGKNPPPERAFFGLDRAGLEARGVVPGLMVTSFKEGLRLGRNRFVARALDDRAGTTALLMAIQAIDPEALPSKVIFAWSVHEEGGLVGAGAMARRYGATTRRIYSVDTFVSSDTPLESPHFAYAPLGAGPVLRAIENSGVSPDAQRARVISTAAEEGIPLQMGLTQGGTDGTQFTFWGAPNQGLSWPGRYSHSPGEVLDLRDLTHLTQLIAALAMQGN